MAAMPGPVSRGGELIDVDEAPLSLQSPRIVVSGQEVRVCGDACRTDVETIANAGLDAWYGLGGLFHASLTPHRYAFGMSGGSCCEAESARSLRRGGFSNYDDVAAATFDLRSYPVGCGW